MCENCIHLYSYFCFMYSVYTKSSNTYGFGASNRKILIFKNFHEGRIPDKRFLYEAGSYIRFDYYYCRKNHMYVHVRAVLIFQGHKF